MNAFKLTIAAIVLAAATTSAFANGQSISTNNGATDAYQTVTNGQSGTRVDSQAAANGAAAAYNAEQKDSNSGY